jgi:hypothetical protein
MVVGFTTTYAISAYHHWCCEFESRSGRGEKAQKDKQRFTKHTYKTKDRVTLTPLKTGGDVMCSCHLYDHYHGGESATFRPFVLFPFAIVLSVILRYTDSDYPFGIFKHVLLDEHATLPYSINKGQSLVQQVEWVIVVKRQLSNFSAISWREQVNFQRDDDEVRFILDKHA